MISKIKLLLTKHLMIYNDKISLNTLSNLRYLIILCLLCERRCLATSVKKKVVINIRNFNDLIVFNVYFVSL